LNKDHLNTSSLKRLLVKLTGSVIIAAIASLLVFVYISSMIKRGGLSHGASFFEVIYAALSFGIIFLIYRYRRR